MQPKIILTRPKAQAERFAADLQAAADHPLSILIAPLMEITPVTPHRQLPRPDHVIFTSANAVAQVGRLDIPRTAQAWCVGDQTTAAARSAGFQVENAHGTSDDLIAQVIAAAPPGLILHLRGAHATGAVTDRLLSERLNCEDLVVYDQRPCPPSVALRAALIENTPLIVPLFSRRSARLFVNVTPRTAPMTIVAISAATAAVAAPIGSPDVIVSSFPDKYGMITATLGAYVADSPPNMP